MDAWQDFKRKREMRKAKRAAGVQAGRGGRKASGGRMVAHPKEPASVHQLMADDARPNLRVWQMWDEACDFESELSHFRDNLSKFENATDEFLKRIEPIMRAPLPRVWDAVEGGLAEPTRATISHGHQHTVGGDVSIAGLEEARSEYHNRLRGHVIRPLHQWSEALGVVQERLPELKRLRQEVIKASRSAAKSSRQYKSRAGELGGHHGGDVDGTGGAAGGAGAGAIIPYRGGGGNGIGSMFGACGRPKVGGGSGGMGRRATRRQHKRESAIEDDSYTSSSSGDDEDDYQARDTGVDRATRRDIEMEEAGMRLNYKHRSLQAARADYAEAEKLIADQLAGLQRDAAWTKSYMVSSLLLTKECMQTAVVSLGNTKQPLPGFQSRSTSLLTGRQGGTELKDNVELAAGMPEDFNISLFEYHMRTGQPTTATFGGRGQQAMAALPPVVSAHKATAAPMELHARPDVGELDRVNTPPVGAGAIPASALHGLDLGGGARERTGAEATRGYRANALGGPGAATTATAGAGAGTASATTAVGEQGYYATSPTSTYASTRGGPRFSDATDARSVDLMPGAGMSGGVSGGSSAVAAPVVGGSSGSQLLGSSTGAAGVGVGGVGGGVGGIGSSSGASVLRQNQSEYVCGRQTFTEVEDRPVIRERVERIVEHRPVEKQYVTEVRYEGETPLPGSAEHLDTRERVVAVTPPGPTCPSGLVASGQSACATAGGVAGAGGVATGGVVGGATDVVVGSSHPLRSRRTHRREHTHGNAIVSSSSSSSSSSDDEAGREHEGAGVHLRSSRHRHMGGVSQTAAGGAGVEGAVGVSSSSSGGRVESVLREDQSEVVCGRQEFKEVEDRPVIRERVERIVEHRPVEKQYVTEVRFEGETDLPGSVETLGPAQERVVEVAAAGPKCPNGVCQAVNVVDRTGGVGAAEAAPAGVSDALPAGMGDQQQRVAAV